MLKEEELASHIGSQRLSEFLDSGAKRKFLGKCQIAVLTAMLMSMLMLSTWYWVIATPIALLACIVHAKKNWVGLFKSSCATRMSSLPLLISSMSLAIVAIGSAASGVKYFATATLFGGVYFGGAIVSGWFAWGNMQCYWALSKVTLDMTETIPDMYKHAENRAKAGHEIMKLVKQKFNNTLVVYSLLSRLLSSDPKWGVIFLDKKIIVMQKSFSRGQYAGFWCDYEHCDIHVSIKRGGRVKISTPYGSVRGSCDLNECKQVADFAEEKGIKIDR